MNYIVLNRNAGKLVTLFFTYRNETNVTYKKCTLIRDVDDVIEVMRRYYSPDNDTYIIQETLLDCNAFRDDRDVITERLRKLLDE